MLPLARTLGDLLRENARLRPSVVAAIADDQTVTFAELLQRAGKVAGALQAKGIRRGDRVGLIVPNRIAWLEIVFGIAIAGGVAVPFSTWSTRDEFEFLLADSNIKFLFSAAVIAGRDLTAEFDGLWPADRMAVVGDDEKQGTYEAFRSSGDPVELPPGDGASAVDDALVLYTSGSTSKPKAVRLQHYALIENGFNIGERQGLREGDRVFLSAPLFWAYGSANALCAAFSHGAGLVLLDRFEAGAALDLIEQHRCTVIYTLPGMTNSLVRHSDFDRNRTRTLRTGLTIGSEKDFLLAADTLGVPEICNLYGSTETYGNCCVTWHHLPKVQRATSQGHPLPGQSLRFRDAETGLEAEPGRPGRVEVRGYITPGYSGASAELNKSIFTADGYFQTGDVGYLNEDGSFVFVARDNDMIKRAGINVSPTEIENVLSGHAGVAQAAVTGVRNAEGDESIVAFVVAASSGVSTAELLSHCRQALSKYKLPDHITLCSVLPTTATGKLERKRLRDMAAGLLSQTKGEAGAR